MNNYYPFNNILNKSVSNLKRLFNKNNNNIHNNNNINKNKSKNKSSQKGL